ncbi:hypothetical protein U1Q18_001078 [Sarracenia purpurea var. burkii]
MKRSTQTNQGEGKDREGLGSKPPHRHLCSGIADQPGRGAQPSRAFESMEQTPTPSSGSSSVEPNLG